MSRVFPRLRRGTSREVLTALKEAVAHPEIDITSLIRFSHPAADPVPTGGTPVSTSELATIRSEVMARVGSLQEAKSVATQGRFDARLGLALHTHLPLIVSDAAHEEVWNFLTLCVFPDVLVARWPKLDEARAFGSGRNALRRTWWRQELLGDVMQVADDRRLMEDELVQLTERTALARINGLSRKLAHRILEAPSGSSREDFSRALVRLVTRETGPLLLDVLDDSALDELIERAAHAAEQSF